MLSTTLLILFAALAQNPQEQPRIKPEDLEPLARVGIERVLSRVLEVPVTVAEVKLLPEEGRVELHDLKVANPQGFEAPHAFTADEVHVEGDVRSLFTRTPEVRLVQVVGTKVNAETRLPQGSNLTKLLESARAMRQGPMPERMRKQWRIQKGVLQQAEVNVGTQLLDQKSVQRTLDTLEMDFMGEDGRGMPAEQAVAKFLTRLVQELDLVSAVAPGAAGVLEKVAPGTPLPNLVPTPDTPERRPGDRARKILDGLRRE